MTRTARRWINDWDIQASGTSLWRRFTPPQLFVGSFLFLIALGTAGLLFLPGLTTGERLGFLDALFTATSAVCVTGLIVVDTATYFTPLGQGFILLLIQLGGLGMITLTTLIIVSLGRRLSLRHEGLSSAPDGGIRVDYRRLTRDVVLFTLTIEALGAVGLYVLWLPDLGMTGAIWPALFHAVSAFCNAGFSTFSDSLIGVQRSPGILLVLMALIVLGGLGFLVMEELLPRLRRRHGGQVPIRMSLHTRLVLASTAALILLGGVLFSIFEWHALLADLPIADRVVNGFFMSVSPRTAGFNNIDYSAARESTNFLTILLMIVGGSPGSTAGGLKTTTVVLLGLLAFNRFRGSEVTSAWGRSVPEETVQRAFGLFVVFVAIMAAAVFAFTLSELPVGEGGTGSDSSFLALVFEVVSAFNTVGLSMGITADLSGFGKVTTILLMLLGRVGPLTFAAAIALRARHPGPRFRYAFEEVTVG